MQSVEQRTLDKVLWLDHACGPDEEPPTIERILVIKRNYLLIFNQEDIREIAPQILYVVLSRIEVGGSPEKKTENDYLMKCAMRIILTASTTLVPTHQILLQRFTGILGAIAKNPSDPNSDQCIFESISTLIRKV